jgi:hypothetical protein
MPDAFTAMHPAELPGCRNNEWRTYACHRHHESGGRVYQLLIERQIISPSSSNPRSIIFKFKISHYTTIPRPTYGAPVINSSGV